MLLKKEATDTDNAGILAQATTLVQSAETAVEHGLARAGEALNSWRGKPAEDTTAPAAANAAEVKPESKDGTTDGSGKAAEEPEVADDVKDETAAEDKTDATD